jgi:hypothetical protein
MSIQTIRRAFIASGIALGAVAAVFSPAAFAATSAGEQAGSITSVETVLYTPAAVFTITPNLTMTDQSFGVVNVQSNSVTGWNLQVASTNGSTLNNGAIATIPYTLTVGGATTNVGTAATPVTAQSFAVLTNAATGGGNYSVLGTIAALDTNGKPSGTYTDTLTFTLTNQ